MKGPPWFSSLDLARSSRKTLQDASRARSPDPSRSQASLAASRHSATRTTADVRPSPRSKRSRFGRTRRTVATISTTRCLGHQFKARLYKPSNLCSNRRSCPFHPRRRPPRSASLLSLPKPNLTSESTRSWRHDPKPSRISFYKLQTTTKIWAVPRQPRSVATADRSLSISSLRIKLFLLDRPSLLDDSHDPTFSTRHSSRPTPSAHRKGIGAFEGKRFSSSTCVLTFLPRPVSSSVSLKRSFPAALYTVVLIKMLTCAESLRAASGVCTGSFVSDLVTVLSIGPSVMYPPLS